MKLIVFVMALFLFPKGDGKTGQVYIRGVFTNRKACIEQMEKIGLKENKVKTFADRDMRKGFYLCRKAMIKVLKIDTSNVNLIEI